MKIAVVGPRRGADLESVKGFVHSLYLQHPDAILVSGGADGVDKTAEGEWLNLGGTVWSYRVRKKSEDHFVIEVWQIGQGGARMFELLNEPVWADWSSALLYRSMLVAEVSDRVCAFAGKDRMRGTDFTIDVSKDAEKKPTYVYRDGEWESHNT